MSFYPPRRNGMKASAIGEKARTRVQSEEAQARVLEGTPDKLGLFQLHRVDWHHVGTPMRDKGTLKSGFPDYLILGDGWLAFLEIKARSLVTGRMGGMHASQHTYHAKLRAAGQEVWTAYLPDDLQAVNLWLREKTGRVINIDGLISPSPEHEKRQG